ncbi:MAG TPA: demethoxyubiquinone hydroxylase family protein [Limnobacter sp.]|nr:demethoxyubiquinone hydroxylase family protein [Limnobacter sp.]
MSNPSSKNDCLTVFYDGSCPLCRREIALYQGLKADQPIEWKDVSAEHTELPAHCQRDMLMQRFHVQNPAGELQSGALAFATLWQALPGWRWLGRLSRLPGVLPMMEWLYRFFLKIRPRMQQGMRWWAADEVPACMVADLRADQAGETGAVWIYKGVLAVARHPQLRSFAQAHLQTEQNHLQGINRVLPPLRRSKLLPVWRLAGFLTGALPALFGPRSVYLTIAAVETFVDRHYAEQIDKLQTLGTHPALLAQLQSYQADECHHRDEATGMAGAQSPNALQGLWCKAIGAGSAAGVWLAKMI